MQRWLLLFLLFTVPATHAANSYSPVQLEAEKEAARQRTNGFGGIDLSGGPATPGGPGQATGDLSGCMGSTGGGISLLGVQSQMGPSMQGISPVSKLGPDHPAMKPLFELGNKMGLYGDRQGATPEEIARNNEARKMKGMSDFYEEILGLVNMSKPQGEKVTSIPDSSAYFQQAAAAHAQYQDLARQYASLYQIAAEAAGACP